MNKSVGCNNFAFIGTYRQKQGCYMSGGLLSENMLKLS